MKLDYRSLHITTETELQRFINEANAKYRAEHPGNGSEFRKLYDLDKEAKKFRKWQNKQLIKAFKEVHSCTLCSNYSRSNACIQEMQCPLESGFEYTVYGCEKNPLGTCPYKNSAGSCFGYCMKDLMKPRPHSQERDEYGL